MSVPWSTKDPKDPVLDDDAFLVIDSPNNTSNKRVLFKVLGTSTQTLTNKTFALGSNTLTGSVSEFNSALTADTFALFGTNNIFTGDNTFLTIKLQDASSDDVFTIKGAELASGGKEVTIPSITANDTFALLNVENDFTQTQIITLASSSKVFGLSIGNSDGTLTLGNDTATMSEFAPIIDLESKGSANPSTLQATITAAADSGSEPVFVLNIERTGPATVATRPLWELRNNSVKTVSVAADGTWDFQTNSLTNGTWDGNTILVPKGGTGVATFTLNGVIVGNGTGNLLVVSPGVAGQILTSRGPNDPPIFADPAGPQFTDVIPANISIGVDPAFSSVIDLNPQGSQVSGFELPQSVDSSIFFKLALPSNIDPLSPNARIRIHIITLATNTSKNIRLFLRIHSTSAGGNVNTAFTLEPLVNVVPPETTESLLVQDISLTIQPSSGQFMTGEIFREGDDSGDTASNILISKIELLIDRVPA